MPALPSVPGRKVVRALEKHGFVVARITGSHYVMRHPDGRGASVPVHPGKDMRRGTLAKILRDVSLTVEDLSL